MQQVDISNGFSWDKRPANLIAWFVYTVKPDAPFTRTELAKVLDENKIGNRMLFGGNLINQHFRIKKRIQMYLESQPYLALIK